MKFLRKIASRYFWKLICLIKKTYFKYFLDSSKDVFVILSPGKVGSSSVYSTLKKNLINAYVFHIHFLSERNIDEGIMLHKNSLRKSVPNHFITSRIFNSIFFKQSKRIKFIILFREPVDRYISDAYQNFNRLVSELDNKNNNDIIDKINTGLSNMEHMDYLENWVKDELHQNLGYDFFKNSKLNKSGYFIDSKDKYDFLFMKMESLNSDFSNASKIFFNSEIKLENANISKQKKYSTLYKLSKSKISLSQQTIDKMKNYKYTKMIYTIK
jgi:hypothetical protein